MEPNSDRDGAATAAANDQGPQADTDGAKVAGDGGVQTGGVDTAGTIDGPGSDDPGQVAQDGGGGPGPEVETAARGFRLICMVRPPATPGAEVFGHVLNGLDGVGYFGETAALKGRQGGCLECATAAQSGLDDGCPIFTTDLLAKLSEAKTALEWYGAFAEAGKVDTVITSEAHRQAYDMVGLEPGDGVKAVVMYQNPLEWMVGAVKYYKIGPVTPGDLLDLCGKWGAFYGDHMRWLDAEGIPWASFDLHAFGGAAALGLEKFCWYYQLEHDPRALLWHLGEHHKADGQWAVKVNPPPQNFAPSTAYLRVFSDAAVKSVIADPMVQENYKALAAKKINRL